MNTEGVMVHDCQAAAEETMSDDSQSLVTEMALTHHDIQSLAVVCPCQLTRYSLIA